MKESATADEIIEECANVILQRAGRDWRAGTAMFQECVNHANAILALKGQFVLLPGNEPVRPKKKYTAVPSNKKQTSNWPSAK